MIYCFKVSRMEREEMDEIKLFDTKQNFIIKLKSQRKYLPHYLPINDKNKCKILYNCIKPNT
jgi:hypothetical protein